MPVMNGPEAVAAIRQIGYTGLVVGLTGNALEEHTAHFINQGADGVLTKPLDYTKLVKFVQNKYS